VSRRRIYYFDNNATTRVAPEVVEAMLPFLTDQWGNPSSIYSFGNEVARRLEDARTKVAALINADPSEVVFTSCGTESNNAALNSALMTNPGKRRVITTAVEHSSNIKFCELLRKRDYDVTFLPVEPDGSIDLHLLDKSITRDTGIVSVMYANNETGVIFPIEEVASICRSHGLLCHTDAVQAAGKLKIDVQSLGVSFLSLSAHKFHAPKGIGLLYVNRRARFQPYVVGGRQEKDRRGGTENVPYIIGMGRAAELALESLPEERTRVRSLRDRLEDGILKTIANTSRNGAKEERLPNTTNIAFDGVEAEAILMLLDQLDICASSGSACKSGSLDPSHVLAAMGVPLARSRGSIRFSLGIYNTDADVDYLLEHLPPVIAKLRRASPAKDLKSAPNTSAIRARPGAHKPGPAKPMAV